MTSSFNFELLPRDLQPYREGNTGIDYVHRFESGKPGPHVLINALTHGNELCGMVALTHILDLGIRPNVGTLTVSFANVEAYESFSKEDPLASRFLVHNFNRIWSSDWLDGSQDSPELRRAREMRAVVTAADHILDIHSTVRPVSPFWFYPGFDRNSRAALAIGVPHTHLVLPKGMTSGAPLIQHGLHGTDDYHGVALLVECGQHFLKASGDVATDIVLRFLAHFRMIDSNPMWTKRPSQKRYALIDTPVIKTREVKFARPVIGMETFARGELIATDGDEEIRSPCDDCMIFMPAPVIEPGRELVYLTQPVDDLAS